MTGKPSAERIGLPVKPFFYTTDQVAMLLSVTEQHLRQSLLYYQGRTVGPRRKDMILAIDISPDDATTAEWRIPESALVAWMRYKGLKYHQRGYVS